MRGKRILGCLSAAVTLCVMVACTPPGPPDPAPSEQSGTPSSTPSASGQADALVMVWYGSAAEEALLRTQLAGLDVEVDLRVVPEDSVDFVVDKMICEGKKPDVIRTGQVLDRRNDLRALAEVDPADFLEGLDWSMQRGKDVIALPYSAKTSLTWINADQFAQAGLPAPTADYPWKTWDRMVQAGSKANGPAATGAAARPAFALDEQSPLAVDAFFWQSGIAYFDDKRAGTIWRTDDGVRTLTQFNELLTNGALANTFSQDLTLSPPQFKQHARQLFEAGQVPVLLSDSDYRPPAGVNALAVPDPCDQQCGPMPGADFLVSLGSHRDADRLMRHLTATSAQLERAELGLLPTDRSALAEVQQSDAQRFDERTIMAAKELGLPPATARATGFSPARPRVDETTISALSGLADHLMPPQQAAESIGRSAAQAGSKAR